MRFAGIVPHHSQIDLLAVLAVGSGDEVGHFAARAERDAGWIWQCRRQRPRDRRSLGWLPRAPREDGVPHMLRLSAAIALSSNSRLHQRSNASCSRFWPRTWATKRSIHGSRPFGNTESSIGLGHERVSSIVIEITPMYNPEGDHI